MSRSLVVARSGSMVIRLHLALMSIVLACSWSGCTVVRLARGGDGGAVVAPIQPGVARGVAEVVLGSPVRDWTSPGGVRYRTYEYDSGCPPRPADAAGAMVMNIITAGLWEIYMPLINLELGTDPLRCRAHTSDRITIAYDEHDVILGIFGEFAELPADGRSGPRKWK